MCGVAMMAIGVLSPQAHAAEPVPFTATANDAQVKLRSGSNHTYYVVGTLKQGQRVTVEEVYFGWFKIEPPEGVYSYISRGYVDAKNDGSVGVVNAEDVEVTAGNTKGPGLSYAVQLSLEQGDKVQIIDQEGSFYRIQPPDGAHVFAPPKSLTRVQAGPPAAGTASADASGDTGASESAAGGSSAGEASGTQATSSPGSGVASDAPASDAKLASADDASAAAAADNESNDQADAQSAQADDSADASDDDSSAGDNSDSPGESSSASASEAADSADASRSGQGEAEASNPDAADSSSADSANEAGAAQANAEDKATNLDAGKGAAPQTQAKSEALRKLESEMLPEFRQPLTKQPIEQMIDKYKAIQETDLPAYDQQLVRLRLEALKRNRALKKTLTDIEQVQQASKESAAAAQSQPSAGDTLDPALYDVIARLEASSVYSGESLPRLFRLVEPASGFTIAYVEPADVAAKQMLGQIVGIVGTKSRDRSMNLYVYNIERIDVLPDSAGGE
jgi:uncharacterized protein YgiM (DUF1202 family)